MQKLWFLLMTCCIWIVFVVGLQRYDIFHCIIISIVIFIFNILIIIFFFSITE